MSVLGGLRYPKIHDRQSLHAFICAQLRPDGSLSDSECALPDEPPSAAGGVYWKAGAVDGVGNHHITRAAQTGEAAQRLAAAIVAAAARPTKKRLTALYALVPSGDGASFVGPTIEALSALRPSTRSVRKIRNVGAWLASESPDRWPVKLGLALLGVARSPDDSVLFELGAHEEFTLFSAMAYCNSRQNPDLKLFRLAKRVSGWGRIHCVERLRNTNDTGIRRWILTDGFRNGVMNEYLAYIAATTGDLVSALGMRAPDRQVLRAATDIICALINGGPAEDIDDYVQASEAIQRWLGHMSHRAETLHDLNTIAAVRDFCDRDDWASRLSTGAWTVEARQAIRFSAATLLLDPAWPGRVREGLDSQDSQQFCQAERAARLLGIDAFDHLLARIDADPIDGPWVRAWQSADDARALILVERATQLLDLGFIASGPSPAIGLEPEFKIYSALGWSLQGIVDHPGIGAVLVEAGMRSASIANRVGALKVLEAWGKGHWTQGQWDSLRTMARSDPDETVRARAGDLLQQF